MISEIDWQTLWPLLLFAALLLLMFWLIVIRPVHKGQHHQKQLIEGITEGDRIVTAGGIHGKIIRLRENDIDVEVADGCVMTFERRAVRRKLQ